MTMQPTCLRSVDLYSLLRSHTGWVGWDAGLPPAPAVPAEVAVPRCVWLTQAPEWEVAHGDLPAICPAPGCDEQLQVCWGEEDLGESWKGHVLSAWCWLHAWGVYACQNLLIIILELEENFVIDKLALKGRSKKPGPDTHCWTWNTLEQTQASIMQIFRRDVLVDPFGPQE